MDILRIPLIILFKEQNPYRIIKNYCSNDIRTNQMNISIDKSRFIDIYQQREPQYSKDEIENMYEVVDDKLNKVIQGNPFQKSVFNLIINYTKEMLENDGNNVKCRYKNLLKWRMTTLELDQDMFVAGYLAFEDLLIRRDRVYFDWDMVIKSNNIRLHNMLSQGMAENHFHLKGSAPTFKLSWVQLMNDISCRKQCKINDATTRLEKDIDGDIDVSDAIAVAALIRLILFKVLRSKELMLSETEKKIYNEEIEQKKLLHEIFNNNEMSINKQELSSKSGSIQSEINTLKHLYSSKLRYKSKDVSIDYCLTDNINKTDSITKLYAGERAFLYECFRAIYNQDKDFLRDADLFYAYLILKNKVRGELIQENHRVGFSNFADYQDRKTQYLKKNTLLKDSVEAQAILMSIKSQNMKSIEARFIPSEDTNENIKNIRKMDELICNSIFNDANNTWINKKNESFPMMGELSYAERKILMTFEGVDSLHSSLHNEMVRSPQRQMEQLIQELKSKYFYVCHFPKDKDPLAISDNVKDVFSLNRCRHYKYRIYLKNIGTALYKMREKNQEVAARVLGIDACANELVTRPEVFGQVFRFLKGHLPSKDYQRDFEKGESIPCLRATYHVGEDFLDVIDGLRAIDEAYTFLNLTHGDRFGHAIVLGIDVEDWYRKKGYRVNLTKQDILDNIAWLIMKIKYYDVTSASEYIDKLTSLYNKYYTEIYCNNDQLGEKYPGVIPVDIYMEAWKLRGDNPEYYNDDKIKRAISYWDRCAKHEQTELAADNDVVENLYMRYHYDINVKSKGYKKEVFKVPYYIVTITKQIQTLMQNTVRECGIGIECNPSSNVLIGTFKRYDKHPILKFNNLGLSSKEMDDMAQLFVSINTDDQGVFDTLLENEFALMAIALEKVKDENGRPVYNQARIYDWLNRVREMGIEQSFNNKII